MPEEVKAERHERFMAAQREVSAGVLAAQVGKTVEVLIDEVDEDGAIGREPGTRRTSTARCSSTARRSVEPGDIVRATGSSTRRNTMCGLCWRGMTAGSEAARPALDTHERVLHQDGVLPLRRRGQQRYRRLDQLL